MTEPLCPYFGSCGGCTLQHLDYSIQLKNKVETVKKILDIENVTVFYDEPYNYRNKMSFIFSKQGLSLRKKQDSKRFIEIKNCVISNKRINELLNEVKIFFQNEDYFSINKNSGTFKFLVIRSHLNDDSISFVLNENSSRLSKAIIKIKDFAKKTTAKNVIVTYVEAKNNENNSKDYFVVKGNNCLKTNLLNYYFYFPIQSFFQNNTVMAEKMQAYCTTILKKYDTGNAHLLDLYGGVGTFGIINSELFKSTTIVELDESAVEFAKKNIEMNKSNATAITLSDTKLKKLNLHSHLFVIIDPPRSGMNNNAIEYLNNKEPEVIIYISCNIHQLQKDIKKFKNYKLKSVALFDLFPQTNHIETIAELVKKK
ncbi:hypothetical protein COV11_03890 [Candidatus Woesearchaeota archaeon CG10_big_fil_rev_8_21_14_0_10_30_7]|nr:MAG: hypothetical protein COV11_03890 [Candidatus Woesearchaeota archaeon CG10_big_fil_rev_8_21_14_0_10_30_7]